MLQGCEETGKLFCLFYLPHPFQINFHNISKYSKYINLASLQLLNFYVLCLTNQQKLTHISVSQVQIHRRTTWLEHFEVNVHPHLISYGLRKGPERKSAQLRLNVSTCPLILGSEGGVVPVTWYIYSSWVPTLLEDIRKWDRGISRRPKKWIF